MKKKIFRVISLVLAAVMTLSLCSCMNNMEDEVIKRASAVPQTKQEIFDYFCKAIDNVKTAKPAISYKLSEKAKSPDCENSNIEAAFATIAKLMTNGKKDGVEYGEDNSALMPSKMFDFKDIKSANIIDVDDITSRSYTIVMTIWEEDNPVQDDSVFGKVYKIAPKEQILEEMKKASAYFTVEDYDSQYNTGTIRATISKETDKISELSLDRNVTVSTEITGQGTLADVGTVPLSFRYESTESYSFDWDNPNTAEVE